MQLFVDTNRFAKQIPVICIVCVATQLLIVYLHPAPLTLLQTPTPLPDALRGEQYAFVGMPVSEFRKGNINDENVGVGRYCARFPVMYCVFFIFMSYRIRPSHT